MDIRNPEPIDAYTDGWKADDGVDFREWLGADERWIASDGDAWTHADTTRVGEYVVTVTDDDVELARVLPGWARYLVYGLLLLAPLVVLSPSILAVALFIAAIYMLHYEVPFLKRVPARRVSHRLHPALAALYVLGVLSLVRFVVSEFSLGTWGHAAVLVALLYAASRLYSRNGLPGQAATQPAHVLQIPLDLFDLLVVSLGAVGGATVFTAWLLETVQTLYEVPERGSASLLADLTAGAIQPQGGGASAELLGQVVQWFPVGVGIVAIYVCLSASRTAFAVSRRLADVLENTERTARGAPRQQLLLALLYDLWGAGVLGCVLVVLGLFWFGLTGVWPLPDAVLAPLVSLLPESVAGTPTEALEVTVGVFDRVVATALGVETRAATLGLMAVMFAPVAVVCAGVGYVLVCHPAWLVVRATQSRPLAASASTLPVVRVTESARAGVEPIRVFGYTVSLFLSPVVIEALDDEQRRSLVEHTIKAGVEPPLPVRILVSLAVVAPGGRNLSPALLPIVDPAPRGPDEERSSLLETVERHRRSDRNLQESTNRESTAGESAWRARVRRCGRSLARWLARRTILPFRFYYGAPRLNRAVRDRPAEERYERSSAESWSSRSSKEG